MELIPDLHPYVGATWRVIFEMIEEVGEVGRKELLAGLQVGLGRPELQEAELVELVWLAVGCRRPPRPYRYSEIPQRGIEDLRSYS